MRLHRFGLLPLLACLVAQAETSPPRSLLPNLEVNAFELPNGLKVLVIPQRRSPLVSVQIAYHVGSKDESPTMRGIAHLLEHLMFRGSRHVRPEMHSRMLDAIGGKDNAFTSEDVTLYHEDLPAKYLSFALTLEAERMRNLVLLPSTIRTEREVVKNERHWRIDDNPAMQALFIMRTSAFRVHPYRWDSIGENEDLDRMTAEDCKAFYDRFYHPNRAVLVIAGDVELDRTKRQVTETFGSIPKGPEILRSYPQEPPQKEMVLKILERPVELPVVVGGYHTPAARAPDMRPLEVLTRILTSGHTSRFYQRLVRKDKLAVEAGGFIEMLEDPGVLMVFAAHLPATDGQAVKQALLDEIEQVRSKGVTAAEVDKAKRQLLSEQVRKLEHLSGIATTFALAETIEGGWNRFFEQFAELEAVRPEDVDRVARQYLAQENLTMVVLRSAGKGGPS